MEPVVKVEDQGSSNFTVTIRIRPENEREKESMSSRNILHVLGKNVLIFDPAQGAYGQIESPSRTTTQFMQRRAKDQKYAFDRVFGETTTQLEVYEATTKKLIPSVLSGYNATVFAYGPTGAGKTYTMMGCDESGPGVMALTMIDLFTEIEKCKSEKQVKVSMSYLEVYNEHIFDLLSAPSGKKQTLELREDSEKGVIVAGLTQHYPKDADEVILLLREGNERRTQAGTYANAVSSRSHAVLQIIVEQTDRTADIQTNLNYAKLSLIDLAGSERAAMTANRGMRFTEGANINKSLLALGNCINALARGTPSSGTSYVPYRDSKLTRLLKDSLGGNCLTVMIAAVSPSSMSYEDTHNTLKYANRAKNIKLTVQRNVLNVNFHVTRYKQIINELRKEVAELKKRLVQHESGDLTATSRIREAEKEAEEEAVEKFEQEIREHYALCIKWKQVGVECELRVRDSKNKIKEHETELEKLTPEDYGAIHSGMQLDLPKIRKEIKQAEAGLEESKKKHEEELSNVRRVADKIPMVIKSSFMRKYLEQVLKNGAYDLERHTQSLEIKKFKTVLDERTHSLEKLQERVKCLETINDVQQQALEEHQVSLDLENEKFEPLEIYDFDRENDDLFLEVNLRRKSDSMVIPVTPIHQRTLREDWAKKGRASLQSPSSMLLSPMIVGRKGIIRKCHLNLSQLGSSTEGGKRSRLILSDIDDSDVNSPDSSSTTSSVEMQIECSDDDNDGKEAGEEQEDGIPPKKLVLPPSKPQRHSYGISKRATTMTSSSSSSSSSSSGRSGRATALGVPKRSAPGRPRAEKMTIFGDDAGSTRLRASWRKSATTTSATASARSRGSVDSIPKKVVNLGAGRIRKRPEIPRIPTEKIAHRIARQSVSDATTMAAPLTEPTRKSGSISKRDIQMRYEKERLKRKQKQAWDEGGGDRDPSSSPAAMDDDLSKKAEELERMQSKLARFMQPTESSRKKSRKQVTFAEEGESEENGSARAVAAKGMVSVGESRVTGFLGRRSSRRPHSLSGSMTDRPGTAPPVVISADPPVCQISLASAVTKTSSVDVEKENIVGNSPSATRHPNVGKAVRVRVGDDPSSSGATVASSGAKTTHLSGSLTAR
eukprot:TRINITY_DN256_c0_g2_i1.p1 TRINITY_DN256_c0_g2~~TRINITY_DN256_c0_g2_i1.p1  ORF type:complete len:1114 (-),score=364.20 TRINITY_DN256_c0_g2_i1:2222-5563(-)